MLNYIIDQSHWNASCYYPFAQRAGMLATFLRFGSIDNTHGVCYEDYLLYENMVDVRIANVPYGAYFYMRPKFDGFLQGDFFVNLLDKQQYRPKLPAVIDVEQPGDYKNIIKMAQRVRSAGYKIMIYTRQQFWDYTFPADPFWKTVDLWAARWTSAPLDSPWGDGKYQFRDWDFWKFWQYSGDGNGRAVEFGFPGYPLGDNDIDLSCYNGTLEEFRTEYKIDNIVPPVPDDVYIVNTQGLRIRREPHDKAEIVGYRNVGEKVIARDYGGSSFWVKDEKGWSAVNFGGVQHMQRV